MLVPLRHIQDHLSSIESKDAHVRGEALFDACITRTVGLSAKRVVLPSEEHPLLLLLDGFDELPLANRAEILAFLDGVGLLAQNVGVSVVLTGRPIAFEPYWPEIDKLSTRETRWDRDRIEQLSAGKGGTCEQFVRKWLIACARLQIPMEASADLIAAARDQGAGFGDIVKTPVLLSLICTLATGQSIDGATAPHLSDTYSVVEWLVLGAIKRRANAADRERGETSESEFRVRRDRFGQWAWEAVLHGGVEFTVSRIETARESAQDTGLVEFLVTPGGEARVEFMHRMVAEFLAADNLVSGMVDPPDNDAFRFIVQAAIGLARRERVFESNQKRFISRRIAALQSEQRRSLRELMSDFLVALYRMPGRLRESTSVPIHALLGAGAEIALMVLLAASDELPPDKTLIKDAMLLRNFSPRRLAPWDSAHSVKLIVDQRLEELGLVSFNFSKSAVRNVSFRGASLLNARFCDSEILNCDFRGADLSGIV